MTDTPPRSSTRFQKLLAAGLGILLALAAGEVLLRLVGAAPEVAPVRRGRFQLSANPRLVFEPVPGLAFEGAPESFLERRQERWVNYGKFKEVAAEG